MFAILFAQKLDEEDEKTLNIFHEDNAFYKYKLIGVANLFLDLLHKKFYAPFEYSAPIINQQGEIAGRLRCRLQRIEAAETDDVAVGERMKFRLSVIEAHDLATAHTGTIVFCQYQFWSQTQPTLISSKSEHSPSQHDLSGKTKSGSSKSKTAAAVVRFDHERDFDVEVTEEFLDYCQVGLA
jgi:hypothetical protein